MSSDEVKDSYGNVITEPCQGKLGRNRCSWPFTFKFGRLWLCRACIAKRQQALVVARAKRFRKRQQGS
jgi:hypothetical protein